MTKEMGRGRREEAESKGGKGGGRERESVCVGGAGCDLLCDRAPQQTFEGLQL